MRRPAAMTCRECRSLLAGYLNRELKPRTRTRVGQHLDSCAACYAEYCRQREIAAQLTRDVPLVGQADAPRLGRIWSAVQLEMGRPRRASLRKMSARFSAVVLMLAAGLMITLSLATHRLALALPVPPTPVVQVERTSAVIAMATEDAPRILPAVEGVTVTPPQGPNYAPSDVTPEPAAP